MDDRLKNIREGNERKLDSEVKERHHKETLEANENFQRVIFEAFKSLTSVVEGAADKGDAIGFIVKAIDKIEEQTDKSVTEVTMLKAGLETLEKQLLAIPTGDLKQLPKFLERPDTIKIENLGELEKHFKTLDKSIKGIKTTVEAPKVTVEPAAVNIPAPIVNVPETDLQPLVKTMLDVIKAVKAIKLPEYKTDNSGVEKLLKKQLNTLEEILDKPVGGGGGGGGGPSWTAVNSSDIPQPLEVVPTDDNPTINGLVVTNPDGSNVGGGSFADAAGNSTKALTGAYNAAVITNARTKFRDGFANPSISQPKTDVWDLVNEDSANAFPHIVNRGGNSSSSAYLRISLSPFIEGSEVMITSKDTFSFPLRYGVGLSMSQRFSGQEVFIGLVGADADGTVPTSNSKADQTLTGNTTVTNNVATITLTNHGFMGGDRVNIFGCAEHRLNVGPVLVTVSDANTITVPITIANGTYSLVGGTIRYIDPSRDVSNYGGILVENTTVTNGTLVARRNGAKPRQLNSTIATTAATQTSGSQYTDAFNSASIQELFYGFDELKYRSYPADSTGSMSGYGKFSNTIPEEDTPYKIRIRARNLTGITRPIARITSISKTGTTTATVTTDVAHGLITGDYVQIYGVRDATNFPNLTAQTVVASAPTSTTFTIVIGGAVAASSLNGTVFKNEGSVLSTALGANTQNIAVSNGIMTLTFNSAISTPLPGEYWHVHGLDSALSTYEGGFKVLRSSGSTTLDLEVPNGWSLSSTATGGSFIKRTDVRIHFVRELDYTRNYVEVMGGAGNASDANNSVPIIIAGGGVTQGGGSTTTMWSAAGYGGLLQTDVAAATLSATTTSTTVTPGQVANIGTIAHSFTVAVGTVTGTNPTLDVSVDESLDNGTTWRRIYDFERITASNTTLNSPRIAASAGTRYRYVQTVGGTTPSFANRAIHRILHSVNVPFYRQFFDRSIAVNTLNSTTPAYHVSGATTIQVVLNMGAITTTAPVITMQGSEDGTIWYNLGVSPTITGVANATAVNFINNVAPTFIRGTVSTAGSGATLGYITFKAMGA